MQVIDGSGRRVFIDLGGKGTVSEPYHSEGIVSEYPTIHRVQNIPIKNTANESLIIQTEAVILVSQNDAWVNLAGVAQVSIPSNVSDSFSLLGTMKFRTIPGETIISVVSASNTPLFLSILEVV